MTQKPNRKSRIAHPAAPATKPTWRDWARSNRRPLMAAGGAAMVIGGVLLNRANAKRAEAASPPTGTFVEVDGVRLHYVDRGDGPLVVLLHGNAVMLQDFELSGVLPLAAERHRVIAFDRPGFGYSERPRSTIWSPAAQAALIAKALYQIGVGPAVVVGHSWGTMVALAMALNHPEAVSGLVLVSGYYYGTLRADVIPAAIPAIPVLGDLIAHTTAPLTGLVTGPLAVKASFAPADVPPRFADFPKAMALRPSQLHATAAEAALMVSSAVALSHRYAEIAVPVLVMAGAGDLIVHVDQHARRLAEDIPGAKLRVVPEQGHLLHWGVPEDVISAIDDVVTAAG
jgi:pimeloyl-ACP methyl ester carboxylesterase